MLQQTSFLARSVVPHGKSGAAIGIPADVRRDMGVNTGDAVDLDYNREDGTLTIHFREQ